MSKWKQQKLSDFGRVVTGKTPPTQNRFFYGGNIPFVTPTDLTTDSYRVYHTNTTLSGKVKTDFTNHTIPKNAIMYTSIASIGKLGISTQLSLTNQQINSIVVDSKKADYRFVYYLLKDITPFCKAIAGGVATPIINKKTFEKIKVFVPPLPTQNRIAEVLSAYDDAIENNNRRIALLEKAARELYKEWFVRMRFPGYETTKFVKGLSEGWEIKWLGEIVDFSNGRTRPISSGATPVYGGNGILAYCGESNQKNSIIIGRVGAFCGSVYFEKDNHWVSDNAISAKSKNSKTMLFVFWALKHLALNKHQVGTGQPLLTQNILKRIKIAVPPLYAQVEFSRIAKKCNNLVVSLQQQSQNLARQRDLLLPRLMSGKLEV